MILPSSRRCNIIRLNLIERFSDNSTLLVSLKNSIYLFPSHEPGEGLPSPSSLPHFLIHPTPALLCKISKASVMHRHSSLPLSFIFVRGEIVDNSYFITEENIGILKLAKEANTILFEYIIPLPGVDTCSASVGSLVPDTSPQMNGLPISIYSFEMVSCVVVQATVQQPPVLGRRGNNYEYSGEGCVAAVMEYKGWNLQEAVDFLVKERPDQGQAGLIAVSRNGKVACKFDSHGMFRGCATEDGCMEVGIWE
ncbi:hypothetical protein LUZ62_066324 [Rhynchospora pubera]|uniref:Uncharacterized protein n=1 Tax=Rhynchospora pubera TaxID=906938 RepID=A0AAV8ETF4_9POAL|nr:hypothetical protein LUZ62_066324 [Rhynchospora pubera]